MENLKKKLILSLFILGLISLGSAKCAVASVQIIAKSQPVLQVQPPQTLPPAQQPPVDFSVCNKSFKVNSQALFYLTLSGINANRFIIDEIQSKSGYILFSVGQRQFLASVTIINPQNSMLKITPCNNNYFFPIGIVQNMFKYIELNLNTPIEKLNVF